MDFTLLLETYGSYFWRPTGHCQSLSCQMDPTMGIYMVGLGDQYMKKTHNNRWIDGCITLLMLRKPPLLHLVQLDLRQDEIGKPLSLSYHLSGYAYGLWKTELKLINYLYFHLSLVPFTFGLCCTLLHIAVISCELVEPSFWYKLVYIGDLALTLHSTGARLDGDAQEPFSA